MTRRLWRTRRAQASSEVGEASTHLLDAREVSVRFSVRGASEPFTAVASATIKLAPGESLGIVGESGAGKTSLARCLAGLMVPTSGSIRYRGAIANAPGFRARMPRVRGVQVVFQDPGASLNPRRRIDSLISEVLSVHRMCDPAQEAAMVTGLLTEVGLSPDVGSRRARTLSGGQQQRAAIARALAFSPELLIADEAVSSLDASVQAQVLNLLASLRETRGLALVMISHDTAVVRQLCDRVAVMYRGEIVETGPTEAVFDAPSHDYTRALLEAVPDWGRADETLAAAAEPCT